MGALFTFYIVLHELKFFYAHTTYDSDIIEEPINRFINWIIRNDVFFITNHTVGREWKAAEEFSFTEC